MVVAMMAALCAVMSWAQVTAGSEPDSSSQRIDTDVFQPPKRKDRFGVIFPAGPDLDGEEGWVNFGFMVDPKGKPFEITVIKSTGNKIFENVARQALERSTFEPATVNGKPVESALVQTFLFDNGIAAVNQGATREFAAAYRSAMNAVEAGNRSDADAAMKLLTIHNLYEDSLFGMAQYRYAAKWGDELQQLDGLRRALYVSEYAQIPKDIRESLMRAELLLDIRLRHYAEAKSRWESMQKLGVSQADAAKIQPVMDQVDKIRNTSGQYDVIGVISSEGTWSLGLFKQHFRVSVSEGGISEMKLRCERRYLSFSFDPSLQYQVSGGSGACHLELLGSPDTHFTLTQF